MHLGIDLDNTIVDTLSICLELFNLHSDRPLSRAACTTYAFFEAYGWDEATYCEMYALYGDRIHREALPCPGAVEAIRHLARDHRITIVTARPIQYVGVSIDWLLHHEVPFEAISFTTDKLATCQSMGIDLLIDDTPSHAHDFCAAECPMILVDHPYNREIDHPLVHRHATWPEIVSFIEGWRPRST